MPEKRPDYQARGRRAAETLKARRGADYFSRIGREGAAVREDEVDFRALGKAGGLATRERHGPEHYQQIGRLGHQAAVARHGSEFHRKAGQAGGAKVRELIQRGQEMEAREREGTR